MKFTLSWLKDYLDTQADAATIANKLTFLGLEVESFSDLAADLRNITVGYIEKAEPHPDADRLKLCQVATKDGIMQIVCGAPNARAGIYVAYAAVGCHIAGLGIKLKKASIRGIESCGMMCSGRELNLSDDHAGIIELPKADIGQDIASVLGRDDVLFDISVLPNRPDAMGIFGIARDLAAAGLGRLRCPEVPSLKQDFTTDFHVDIATSKAQGFYGFVIRGVKNISSPDWLQQRLETVGIRSISAVVDVTNYISHAFGRPLHAFDAARVKDNLVIRQADNAESFKALNEQDYTLTENDIVISDKGGSVLALAGVIGGLESGCQEDTTDIILESALFDAQSISQTAQRLQITTDARQRFERGVDPEFTTSGAILAAQMITEICSGQISQPIISGHFDRAETIINLPESGLCRLTGLSLPLSTQREVLETLGCAIIAQDNNTLRLHPPSWRPDWRLPADCVQEIIRLHGLDTLSACQLMPTPEQRFSPVLNTQQALVMQTKILCAGQGFHEVVSWSFGDPKTTDLFSETPKPHITLANPIASQLSVMRQSLLPGLLTIVERNLTRAQSDLALFELGHVYQAASQEGELPTQSWQLACIRTGHAAPLHWQNGSSAQQVDIFSVKTDILAILQSLGIAEKSLQIVQGKAQGWHPGRCGFIQMGPQKRLATFGQLHPKTASDIGIDKDVMMAVLDLELVLSILTGGKPRSSARTHYSPPKLHPVMRDFAFVINKDVPVDSVIRKIRKSCPSLIQDIRLFDIYQGSSLPDNHHSLAFSVTIQPQGDTPDSETIQQICQKIIDDLCQDPKISAKLR